MSETQWPLFLAMMAALLLTAREVGDAFFSELRRRREKTASSRTADALTDHKEGEQ